METHNEYKYYNDVTVTIKCNTGDYTLSAINKKGLPGDNCGAHLESLTIEPPVVSTSNPQGIATKGTITVIDYHDSVFNFLRSHLDNYINGKKSGEQESKLLPKVEITIDCFTGTYNCSGYILDWSMNFSGSIPSIDLSWSNVCPDGSSEVKDNTAVENTSYRNDDGGVQKLIDELKNKYNSNLKFVFIDSGGVEHEDINNYLQFRSDPVNYKISGQPQTENGTLNGFMFIVNNVSTKSGDNISGEISKDDLNKYETHIKDPEKTASNNKENVASELIFVQNGKYPAYSNWTIDKTTYCVIPMTSFSFSTEFKKLALQSKILTNPNGGTVEQGGVTTQTNASAADASADATSKAQDQSNDAITVKFDCENVMSFNRNDIMSQINFVVFNENGIKHPVSGTAMVRSCTYTLKGGVVHASVECTQVFGSLIVKENNTVAPGVGANAGDNASKGKNETAVPNITDTTSIDYITYLKSEDKYPVSLDADKTEALVNDGTFAAHVAEFLNDFGSFTGFNKLLSHSFVKKLIATGNFGLLTLLLGAANYGINASANAFGSDFIDAIHINPEFSKYSVFCSSNTGKTPYDYKSGGLGIAHWDSGNYINIYENIGFKDNTTLGADVLLTSGSITSWNKGNFVYYDTNGNTYTIERYFPTFSSGAVPTLFDNGLKQNNDWLLWATSILNYKANNVHVFQQYLFKLWITKMWIPVINILKSKHSRADHAVCLQDAVRLARAKSSKSKYAKDAYGKNVATQYSYYRGDDKRYVRQKCFCRRCADIIGVVVNSGNPQYIITK